MSDQSSHHAHLAALFEDLTGTSTVTEQQRIDIPNRINHLGIGEELSEYVGSTATENPFTDVIEAPDQL